MLNDLVRSADAAAYEWTDSGTLVARRGGRSSSRTSRELEAIARSSYSHQAALSLGNPGSWYQHEYQRRPGRDGVPRSASPAVIRWAAQAERQEPLSWKPAVARCSAPRPRWRRPPSSRWRSKLQSTRRLPRCPSAPCARATSRLNARSALTWLRRGARVDAWLRPRFHTRCIDQWLCEEQRFKDRRCPSATPTP